MVAIKGAKGGSKKQRSPVESPDSLVSIAYARIVDLVTEGEAEGLVDGDNSIYLDETPAGSGGFSGFTWEQRTGTQDQSHIAGFSQVENEINIGVELRDDAPWIRSVTNLDLSAVRVNFSVPRLSKQDTNNGDIVGYRVAYFIDLAEGSGPFQTVINGAFDGKTSGGYERSVRIDLEGRPAGGWRIRVRRETPNSESSAIADTTNIKSITEIIDSKFRYPNSAVVGISFDAETFGGAVPRRGYHMRGRIIRVPTNYDPVLRTYSGIWDGNFKLAYSNNPAWVYFDLLLHPRYGLGDRVNANQVDKWGLYQIAQHCDQMVPDGKGGMEPRFTCNLYLQRASDAYKVLQDIAAIFRGITYWGTGQAIVTADIPADADYTYTNGNVIGGKFHYKGSKRSTRFSAALVSWNDPTDMFRAKVEYVQDDDAVARFGIHKTDIIAIGCTSQGQAQRAGKWALLTNLLETETVTFSVGLEGIRGRPGQVIRVADNDRAGRRIGGRVSSATASSITADKVDGVQVGDDLTCIMPDGLPETRKVSSVNGRTIGVSPAFRAAPQSQSVWAWESESLAAQRFRIIGISESGPMEYTITATKYVEGKHAAVDTGAIISQRPITSIPASVQLAPENIRALSNTMIEQTMAVTTMTVLWDVAAGATRYDVEWRRGETEWVFAGRTGTNEIDVVGIYAGSYQIRVRAINSLDIVSPWGYSEIIELAGKIGNPPAPAYLNTEALIFGIRLRWGFPSGATDTLRTEIQYSTSATGIDPMHLGDYAYPLDNHDLTGLSAGKVFYFRARLIDRTGNVGPWTAWVFGQSSSDATAILDYIADQISETELSQELRAEIELISGNGSGSVNERIGEVNDRVDTVESQLADIIGAPDWDILDSYLEGSLVYDVTGLYRAIQDVPDGIDISNTLYWERLGDYDSLGELVAALSVRTTLAEADIDQNTGDITAISDDLVLLNTRIGDAEDEIEGNSIAIGQLSTEVGVVDGKVEAVSSSLDYLNASVRPTRADGEKADALEGWYTTAAYAREVTVRVTEKEATAKELTTLQSSVGDATALAQQAIQTSVDLEGNISASWTMKLQVNSQGRYVFAGVGLGIENVDGNLESQFLVEADRFAVLNTLNGQVTSPFVVQGGQTIINNAIIGAASIGSAKLADWIESDAIGPGGVPVLRLNFRTGEIQLNSPVIGGSRLALSNQRIELRDASNNLIMRMGSW